MNNILILLGISFTIAYGFHSGFINSIAGAFFKVKYGDYWNYKKKKLITLGLQPLDLWSKPFNCHLCMSFWSVLLYQLFQYDITAYNLLLMLSISALCSYFSKLAYMIMSWIDSKF
jgi:hypothetical protein